MEIIEAKKTEKPALALLRDLDFEHELVFPLEKRSSIKAAMYTFGPEWGRSFTGWTDNENRTFHVKRLS